jgi:hypothetical protein
MGNIIVAEAVCNQCLMLSPCLSITAAAGRRANKQADKITKEETAQHAPALPLHCHVNAEKPIIRQCLLRHCQPQPLAQHVYSVYSCHSSRTTNSTHLPFHSTATSIPNSPSSQPQQLDTRKPAEEKNNQTHSAPALPLDCHINAEQHIITAAAARHKEGS